MSEQIAKAEGTSLTPPELEEAIKHVTAYDDCQVGMLDYTKLWRLIVAARHYIWMLNRVEELQGEREQGRLEGIDEAAIIFDKKAEVHAAQAVWMGPQRQRYEGARRDGVEMLPMNGPAVSHDAALQYAAEIRALAAISKATPNTGER